MVFVTMLSATIHYFALGPVCWQNPLPMHAMSCRHQINGPFSYLKRLVARLNLMLFVVAVVRTQLAQQVSI